MASTRQILIFNQTGQSLVYRVNEGRPTSGTFVVVRDYVDDYMTPEFSGTLTIDTVNTTVSQASGRSQTDPTLVYLASVAGIAVGKRYLLTENNRREWVEPIEVGPNYVRSRNPLANDYTTAATFQGTHVSAAVDSTWIANANNITWYNQGWWATTLYPIQQGQGSPLATYRIVYTVTVGGSTYVHYDYFDVVRAPVEHHVTGDDIDTRAPGLIDSLPQEYQAERGQPIIEAAWRSVRSHLLSVGVDPQTLRDNEALDELVILRSLRSMAEAGWSPPAFKNDKATFIKLSMDNYNRFFEDHVSVVQKLRTAAGAGGAATFSEPEPFFIR